MMNKADQILNNIIEWAKEKDLVRGLIIVGSRALNGKSDDLSDFDISIFTSDTEPFTHNDGWISKIANQWVYSPDKYEFEDILIPTRLVIYEGGIKVDYSLWNIKSDCKAFQI